MINPDLKAAYKAQTCQSFTAKGIPMDLENQETLLRGWIWHIINAVIHYPTEISLCSTNI